MNLNATSPIDFNPTESDLSLCRSRGDAFAELRGGGQPARAGQGRQEEAAEEAEDPLHQPAAAGEVGKSWSSWQGNVTSRV